MSIRFACKCGKHLRAGDTMAGRHTLCPKCGALVAIPTKEQAASSAVPAVPRKPNVLNPVPNPLPPASPGGADDAEEIGPILVRVRRRNDKDPNKFRRSIWVPLDPERGPPPEKLPRPARTTSRRRYEWKLETYWFQSLSYPLRAWRLLTGLALAQSAHLVWMVLLLPRLNGVGESPPAAEILVFTVTGAILAIYTLGLFDCVLISSGAGEYRIFRGPGVDLDAPGVASTLLCFLAGPIVPAVVGIVYWIRCGDPDAIDWSILIEMVVLTFGYWLLEVLAARAKGRWLAGPAAVVSLAFRLGPRTLLAAVGPPVLLYFYVQMAIFGLTRWHTEGPLGFFRLFCAQLAGLYCGILFLRVLGVWSYRTLPAKPESDAAKESESPAEPTEKSE
jgi:hypothetical protein